MPVENAPSPATELRSKCSAVGTPPGHDRRDGLIVALNGDSPRREPGSRHRARKLIHRNRHFAGNEIELPGSHRLQRRIVDRCRAEHIAYVQHPQHIEVGQIVGTGEQLLIDSELGCMVAANRFDASKAELVFSEKAACRINPEHARAAGKEAGDLITFERSVKRRAFNQR